MPGGGAAELREVRTSAAWCVAVVQTGTRVIACHAVGTHYSHTSVQQNDGRDFSGNRTVPSGMPRSIPLYAITTGTLTLSA